MTKEEAKKYRREYRARTNNAATKKYEKTKNGFLMRTYRNMKSRVTGVQTKKAHLYEGKELLEKQDFYKWSLANNSFHNLFELWEASNYNRKLTPSINRIDAELGYVFGNMEWITHSENSRRTSRWSK